MSENIESLLQARGIKPTAMRMLILKNMLDFSRAFSLADLEAVMETADKSTIFRTITLFHEKQLIHSIDDGSGAVKYSVCNSNCYCSIDDTHAHLYCLHCHKTFCLEKVAVPDINIPDKLIPVSINLVIKGFCENCTKFAT
jgi:Fur family ferric uptake transcriptional regulator